MKTKKHEYLPVEYYRIGQEVQVNGEVQTIKTIYSDFVTYGFGFKAAISNIKPVLRRMESMTEEERSEYQRFIEDNYGEPFASTGYLYSLGIDIPTWVGDKLILSLIDAGLAVDAATLEGDGK